MSGIDLSDLTGVDIDALTPAQLAVYDGASEGVFEFFAKVSARIQKLVDEGVEVADGDFIYQNQLGRGSNNWCRSEEDIVKMLKARRLKKDEIYPAKLISPAQVLNLDNLTEDQKAKIKKDYIEYKASKKKTAKRVKREAPSATAMFGDVAEQPTVSFF